MTTEQEDYQEKKTWAKSNEEAHEHAVQEVSKKKVSVVLEEKLMVRWTRKYYMFPTKAQLKSVKQFMEICRWTYNHAVTHFWVTSEFQKTP